MGCKWDKRSSFEVAEEIKVAKKQSDLFKTSLKYYMGMRKKYVNYWQLFKN